MHESESEVAQWCPTLRDPMDCSLLGSSAHGIFQARVLESACGLENMEKNQSKLKNTITEMKKALEEINSRLSDTYPLQYSCLENPMDGGAW